MNTTLYGSRQCNVSLERLSYSTHNSINGTVLNKNYVRAENVLIKLITSVSVFTKAISLYVFLREL